MEQSGKIRWHHWKERLKMCKTAKFEGATPYKRVKIQLRKGTKIYRRLYGGGNKLAMSKAEKKNCGKVYPLYY